MDLMQIIVLALIQGLTEFLPISSSAHLVLPSLLTDWPDQGLAFDIALHAGSLTAVVYYFRGDLQQFLLSFWQWFREGEADAYVRLIGQVIIATIPIVIMGLLLRDWIETHSRALFVMAATSIGFAILMWIADSRVERPGISEFQLSWRDALLIGCLQMLAIIPGTSRSGITITAGLLLGMTREASARFAFLLAIPTIAGAATLGSVAAYRTGQSIPWSDVAVGFGLSALVSYVAIHYFIKLIERTGLLPYVIYRLAMGAVLIGFGMFMT